MNKVRAKCLYRFVPVMIDRIHDAGAIGLAENTIVRVINLPMAPKCNTMGQCHIEHENGEFIGMVSVHSLQPLHGFTFAHSHGWQRVTA
jgi:hypothetical protein